MEKTKHLELTIFTDDDIYNRPINGLFTWKTIEEYLKSKNIKEDYRIKDLETNDTYEF